MPIESNSSQPQRPEPLAEDNSQPNDFDGVLEATEIRDTLVNQQASDTVSSQPNPQNLNALQKTFSTAQQRPIYNWTVQPRALVVILVGIVITFIGIVLNNSILGVLGTVADLLLSLAILLPRLQLRLDQWFSSVERGIFTASIGLIVSVIGLIKFSGFADRLLALGRKVNWEASGTLAEWFGALGQIAIAVIAVYVAWRQYVISKELTIQQNQLTVQQNIITQQQTIDSYFQGISDLVLDEEGLLEDWPQERAIAEGRTAAILSSVDANGKAKIIRFLSRSKLLTPLKRDRHLGRAILDGIGGYAEDRLEGLRVIDLGVMLAGADLSRTDLRWT
ncbi:pentapeptide repeat-containing protein, partial [Aetokthonos hydrillicola]